MRNREKIRSIEPLETKTLLSASPTAAASASGIDPSAIYSFDGSGNNLANSTWGMAGGDLFRGIVAAQYGDDISTMNGEDLPSGRVISNVLGTQVEDIFDDRNLAAFIYAWG